MDFLEALLLGLVQGITEWIPVSSTGHLVLVQEALGIPPSEHILFDLILHAATLLSVTFFLRKELKKIILSALTEKSKLDEGGIRARKLGWFAILATIPAAAAGLLAGEHIEEMFTATATAIALLLTGALLWLAEMPWLRKRRDRLRTKDALMIGCFQAFSIFPGISRSGSTIASGCYLGFTREMVAIFSFLMSIPIILAGIIYGVFFLETIELDWPITLSAAFVAALTGYFALKWLFSIIQKYRLRIFAAYCWVVGVIALILLA